MWAIIVVGIALGGGLGLYTARTVKMTAMPQLVSLFNAVGGGAAALIAIDDYLRLVGGEAVRIDLHIFIVLDIIIGSITFTGLDHRVGQAAGAHPGQADHRAGRPARDARARRDHAGRVAVPVRHRHAEPRR